MHLMGDGILLPSPGPWGLSSGGLADTIDICKMTHLDRRAPCWWSMSGLAESQELQWGYQAGRKCSEGLGQWRFL